MYRDYPQQQMKLQGSLLVMPFAKLALQKHILTCECKSNMCFRAEESRFGVKAKS